MAIQGGPKINQDGLVLWVDASSRKSFRGEPTTNLVNTASLGLGRYNNPQFSGSITTTTQTFKGAPIYEAIFYASASSFVPRLGSTEGFGLTYASGHVYTASLYYVASVYFRTDYPIPTSSTQGFQNQYSNIPGWGTNNTTTTRYIEGDWIRLYTQWNRNTNGFIDRGTTINTVHTVNTVATTTIIVSRSIAQSNFTDPSLVSMSVGHNPLITSNGGLTGLSILNHGTETSSWTKLSYPSNVITTASMPYLYYLQLSVPNTNGVNTNITMNYLPNAYYLHSTDNKFWKVTFDTASLVVLPLDLPIRTYWAAPMVEIKTGSLIYPSEFTFGTRGGTKETGGGWLDLTSNNYSGSIINSCSYDTQVNGAITFNGINQYVTFGDILNMPTNDFTLDAWLKSTSTATGNNNGIIYKKGTSQTSESGYRLNMPGGAFNFTVADGTTFTSLTAGSGYNDGRWRNVTAVARRGTQLELYVNGNIIGSASSAFTSIVTSSVNFAIGGLNTSGLNWYHIFSGSIAAVKVYNRALSQTEIIDNFDSMRSRFGI